MTRIIKASFVVAVFCKQPLKFRSSLHNFTCNQVMPFFAMFSMTQLHVRSLTSILVVYNAKGLSYGTLDLLATYAGEIQSTPACAQWCISSLVRANFQKYDLDSAPIARTLPRNIVPFFKFFKIGKCFKTMLFPVSCNSQKPLAFQKHSLLLIQPKTHVKTLSERSQKCATVQILTGTDSVARATYLQRAL